MNPLACALTSFSLLLIVALIPPMFKVHSMFSRFSFSLLIFNFFNFAFLSVLMPFCSYLLCMDVTLVASRVFHCAVLTTIPG